MMTREAKIGLMMIAVLVGVFGFLIYKRIHRPGELLARAEIAAANDRNSLGGELNDKADDPLDEPLPLPEPVRGDRGFKKSTVDFEEIADDEDLEQVESKVLEQRLRTKPRLPVDLSEDDESGSQRQTNWNSSRRKDGIQLPEPADDVVEDSEPPALTRHPASRREMETSDPFDNGPSIQQEEADESESDEIRQVKSESRAYELPAADEEVVELPALETDEPSTPFDSDNERRMGSTRRRAAPESFSLEAESSRSETATGETYTVQPNDNFWNISRKRYGAGRYYMALAMHNRRTVSDPKRMKPGVVISTPDATVLEQQYPEAMPKAAADSSDSVNSTRSRQSVDSERSGYFVGENGEPMYRVGPRDTLTDIAKTHLNRTSRWVQILNMNRNVLRDGNELKVGTVLRLPADASRVRVAESASTFR